MKRAIILTGVELRHDFVRKVVSPEAVMALYEHFSAGTNDGCLAEEEPRHFAAPIIVNDALLRVDEDR